MSGSSLLLSPKRVSVSARLVAIVAAYVALGAVLLWSRLFELGHSFWTDELFFVDSFVRKGPRAIMTEGLSHELYALLTWAASTLVGESEVVFRLLSAVPFIAGVVLVTAWLHVRLSPLAGVLYLFLATVSPLLLDITRQARGYGLAFVAMSVVVVAALEANRTGRKLPIALMCVGGVLGAWTLPQFEVALLSMLVVLLLDRRTRWTALAGMVATIAVVYAWYAPHAGQVGDSSQTPDGLQISLQWLATAPLDFTLFPGLIWIDGTAAVPGWFWLPFIALAVVVMRASPLVRQRQPALLLVAAPVGTMVFLWVVQAYVVPRYVSFLLVPIFVLLSSGAASILQHVTSRPPILRTLACLVVIAVLGVRFVSIAPDVVGLPREANRDVAGVIRDRSSTAPVFAYMRHSFNLEFYLGRPVIGLKETSTVAERVCRVTGPAFYVWQPFELEPVRVPCLERPGVEHHLFRQYARGDEMEVWYVPPADAAT
jgi:hypothetical protein